PNMAHNGGNNVYTYLGTEQYLETIWDAGGTDLVRASGSADAVIDLREGKASQLGQVLTGVVFDPDTEQFQGFFTDPRTVWIAYGTAIENGTGGSGDDLVMGNRLANVLRGSGGDDTLKG